VCDLYDTVPQKLEPIPDLNAIDEIVFTSPSTVRAFVEIFRHIPQDKTLTCLGPITQEELQKEIL
jgi:uroporphyrinogen-III synthase